MSAVIPHPPNTARALNMWFGSCSFKQILFHSLGIYLFIFLGEAGKYHTSIFLSPALLVRKTEKAYSLLGWPMQDRLLRLLPPIHHLLVSRLWTTTSSPAVLHAQVPSGRRFLRAMRSGETPNQLRGNPTSGLPLSQTFIYLFCAQELHFIPVLPIAEGIYTTERTKSLKAPQALSLSKVVEELLQEREGEKDSLH